MQVKALKNLGRGVPPLREGQVADIDDEVGTLLIEHGFVEAVPVDQEGSVAKAEADLVAYRDKHKKAE